MADGRRAVAAPCARRASPGDATSSVCGNGDCDRIPGGVRLRRNHRRRPDRAASADLARVGWRFAAAAAIYAVHVGIRAVALWRSLLDGPVRFADVLRIRLSGEAVEMLTFTGPFLAEPAKGWLLRNRGVTTAAAFAAVITEYLLYTVVAAWLMVAALWLLLVRGVLPPGMRPAASVAMGIVIAFLAA
ncbi:MAG: hypothetical protein DMG01_25160, partial [Acidobacteria bacterium]